MLRVTTYNTYDYFHYRYNCCMAMTEVQSPLNDAGKNSQIENEDDEEIEESKEDGVLFYQNRSGIPVDDKTWARMWSHATKIHPDGVNKVQSIKAQESWSEVWPKINQCNAMLIKIVLKSILAEQKKMNPMARSSFLVKLINTS